MKKTKKSDKAPRVEMKDLKAKTDPKGGSLPTDRVPHKHLAGVKYEDITTK